MAGKTGTTIVVSHAFPASSYSYSPPSSLRSLAMRSPLILSPLSPMSLSLSQDLLSLQVEELFVNQQTRRASLLSKVGEQYAMVEDVVRAYALNNPRVSLSVRKVGCGFFVPLPFIRSSETKLWELGATHTHREGEREREREREFRGICCSEVSPSSSLLCSP